MTYPKGHWKKLGRLYEPNTSERHPALLTHTANPLPVHMHGDIFRIFYSGRDKTKRSSVGAVDIDIVKQEIVEDHYAPFFSCGTDVTFFVDGISIGNVYRVGNQRYIGFMGWRNPPDAHWHGKMGRLRLNADLTLSLDSHDPILEFDHIDPLSLSYPWVQTINSGGYQMWYGTTLTWDGGNGEMVHVINGAVSHDGEQWIKTGLAVPYEIGRAQAFSRPTVALRAGGGADMWFSYRSGSGETYRIGRAVSDNGVDWSLALEDSGINVSQSPDWDDAMIEYPFVFDHKGSRYMLYNGNGYGETGFGLAVWCND